MSFCFALFFCTLHLPPALSTCPPFFFHLLSKHFMQMWHDEYLMWDPADYGGVKKIKVQSNSIWLPDLFYYNR